MKKLTIGLLLTFSFLCARSQEGQIMVPLDSVMAAYDEEVMSLLPSEGKYILGKKEYRVGFFNRKLRKELEKSPQAFQLYKKYRSRAWRGFGLLMGSLTGMIVASAVAPGPVILIFIIPYFIGLTDMVSCQKFFYHAIWQYSRDELENRLRRNVQ